MLLFFYNAMVHRLKPGWSFALVQVVFQENRALLGGLGVYCPKKILKFEVQHMHLLRFRGEIFDNMKYNITTWRTTWSIKTWHTTNRKTCYISLHGKKTIYFQEQFNCIQTVFWGPLKGWGLGQIATFAPLWAALLSTPYSTPWISLAQKKNIIQGAMQRRKRLPATMFFTIRRMWQHLTVGTDNVYRNRVSNYELMSSPPHFPFCSRESGIKKRHRRTWNYS